VAKSIGRHAQYSVMRAAEPWPSKARPSMKK